MSLTSPNVAIVVLNWNGCKDSIECLESLQQIEYPDYTIVFVDNGSSDGSAQVVREKFPGVVLLENTANLGFAQGNNVGIRYALAKGAERVLLLNNDTTVAPSLLQAFADTAAEYPLGGVLGAKIYYANEPSRIWYAGARWYPDRVLFNHDGLGQLDNGRDWEKVTETAYACGCALYTRSDVLTRVGLLDARFFNTWEETDWCYRARRSGYKVLVAPAARVWHKVSASFGGGPHKPHYHYFWTRNRLLWLERNVPWLERLRCYKRRVLLDAWQDWRDAVNENAAPAVRITGRAGFDGIRDYGRRRFGDCPAWLVPDAGQREARP